MTTFKSQMIFSRLPTCATLRGMGEYGKDFGIVLHLGPRSENTVEPLRFQKSSANNKRGEEVNDSEGDIKFSEDV